MFGWVTALDGMFGWMKLVGSMFGFVVFVIVLLDWARDGLQWLTDKWGKRRP